MKNPRPISVSIAVGLLIAQALFWAGFALIVGLGIHPGLPDSSFFRVFMAVLALLCAGLLVLLAIRLAHPGKLLWYAAVIFLCGIIILTFTDEVGFVDLAFLFLPLIPLVLLLRNRRWYFQPGTALHSDESA